MRALLMLFVAFATLSIAACNTVAGLGQDIAGHAVSDPASGAR